MSGVTNVKLSGVSNIQSLPVIDAQIGKDQEQVKLESSEFGISIFST